MPLWMARTSVDNQGEQFVHDKLHEAQNLGRLNHAVRFERHVEDQRMCFWKMYQFHKCLVASTGEENPFLLYPNILHDLFSSKPQSVYNVECADFRLGADAYCTQPEIKLFTRHQANKYTAMRLMQFKNKIRDLTKDMLHKYLGGYGKIIL